MSIAPQLIVDRIHLWNPALGEAANADRSAVVGGTYRTRIRGVVPAELVYEQIDATTVRYVLRSCGMSESGIWRAVDVDGGRTEVTHSFTHHGALLRAMRRSFEPVALWRVTRLRALVS
ncbi:hypothetical protein [Microbacterium sp. XT11]|uniref:hypothetical protein n=1 Tax=Microbacterium sp. XT11 TaxID=367477 RepID=UPI0008366A45|nr:hypothetical protein [Microbacterium sp. XT11]